MRLRFLAINICGHTVVATQILRLQLTCTNPKTQMRSEIIKIQIIGIPTNFL